MNLFLPLIILSLAAIGIYLALRVFDRIAHEDKMNKMRQAFRELEKYQRAEIQKFLK